MQIRQQPRSTLILTLFPYPALFRSTVIADNNVDIKAHSVLNGTLGVDVKGKKMVSATSFVPTAGISYAKTENEASITIDGTVKSLGKAQDSDNSKKIIGNKVSIVALAEDDISNEVSSSVKKDLITEADPAMLIVAVGVTDSTNKSSVNINKSVTSVGGDLQISALTDSTFMTSVTAGASDGSLASAAINVSSHDTAANVVVDGEINAYNYLAIDATNNIAENTVRADNTHGMAKFKADYIGKFMNAANVGAITKAAKGLIPESVTDKLSFLGTSGSGDDKKSVLDNLFSAGAAVVVANETNIAGIKVTKESEITAGNKSI